MLWFTSDTHFGHSAIVSHCHRPFKSVDDMDTYIIDRLNRCVKPSDELYHLGDFAWTGKWREYRDRINCQTIYLIAGNHDSSRQLKQATKDGLFSSISYYERVKRDGIRAILCHYPIQSWQPGFVHLHGHSHGHLLPEVEGRKDVGVDAQSFSPVSMGAVKEMRLQTFDDRHKENYSLDPLEIIRV